MNPYMVHTDTGDQYYKCNHVGCEEEIFIVPKDLNTHFLEVHGLEKGLLCILCDKSFRNFRDFGIHIIKHTDEHPFKCKHCEKRFQSSDQLRDHQRRHTSVPFYVCDLCGKGYTKKREMNEHKMCKHFNQNPYVCEICGKGYPGKMKLDRHYQVHTRPFQCSTCGKGFARKGTLEIHMTQHMDKKQFKCGICFLEFRNTTTAKKHLNLNHQKQPPYRDFIIGPKPPILKVKTIDELKQSDQDIETSIAYDNNEIIT
ncbi:unnamed protein product [Owenia fusiformis]|uniref:C2H2-type domain-containing protein n=1 Tax=Owenia fusiformis TaxID=6347 RepID=A0A8S4PJI4_OWEFU|nr:unnamed protein product [Owenia fusiformis]